MTKVLVLKIKANEEEFENIKENVEEAFGNCPFRVETEWSVEDEKEAS